MSLISKKKLGFVDGSIQTPPKTDAIYKSWDQANDVVISWITRSTNRNEQINSVMAANVLDQKRMGIGHQMIMKHNTLTPYLDLTCSNTRA
ncbi:hypothetical protein Lal_00000849 [Lupinus albus]|nr:hypothetical protein Lal_00000849 [Lupinus albus]